MKEFSIYHLKRFGHAHAIRFNLAAVKRLLPDCTFETFDDLTERQRAAMQRRVNAYVERGGRVDLSGGVDAVDAQIIPAHIIPARKGVARRIVPEEVISAKPELPPSIDHLPHHSLLDEIVTNDIKQSKKLWS